MSSSSFPSRCGCIAAARKTGGYNKERVPGSMFASEALAQARAIHMVENAPGGARPADGIAQGLLRPCQKYDEGKCARFSEATSFSSSLRVRLWVRQMEDGGFLRGVSVAVESTTPPPARQGDDYVSTVVAQCDSSKTNTDRETPFPFCRINIIDV